MLSSLVEGEVQTAQEWEKEIDSLLGASTRDFAPSQAKLIEDTQTTIDEFVSQGIMQDMPTGKCIHLRFTRKVKLSE